jgi:hypothetical protein
MSVTRLNFSNYESAAEFFSGTIVWDNIQGAGSPNQAGGAYTVRPPNSADMTWLRSNKAGGGGSANIPAGSIIRGIQIGFRIRQTGGTQSGGQFKVAIFKDSNQISSPRSGSFPQNGDIGFFGGPTDLWGIASPTPEMFASGIYFGHYMNFPSISQSITVYSWAGTMDIYYDEPPPAATSISVNAGNGQNANINTQYAFPMTALVRDQGGSPFPGATVLFQLPGSGPSATFPGGSLSSGGVTNAQGVATSPLFTANAIVGSFQVVASVGGLLTRFSQQNTAPPVVLVPTTMTIVQGNGQSAPVGTTFPTLMKVKVVDQFGAAFPNGSVTWTNPTSGASGLYAGGTTNVATTTDSLGIATAPALTANAISGGWVAAAVATGFPSVNKSFSFTNIANTAVPVATSLALIQGANQTTNTNTNFAVSFQVRVLDQNGAPFAGGTSVQGFTGGTSTGTFVNGGLSSLTVVSDSSGVASFGLIRAGVPLINWSTQFTVPGTPAIPTVQARNLNTVDPVVSAGISAVSGQGQITPVSTAFSNVLRARVTNGAGVGLQNVSVTFTAPGTGASCTIAGGLTQAILTDVNGYAQTTAAPVANATNGGYFVIASIAGSSANFNLANGDGYLTAIICTARENLPSGAQASNIGSGVAWTNPQNASAAGGGASFASVIQPYPTPSKFLLCAPAPASWAAVDGNARVVSLSIQHWANDDTKTPNVQPIGVYYYVIVNGALDATNFGASSTVPPANSWAQGAVFTLNATGPTYFTVAQMRQSNCGIGILAAPVSTQDPANQLKVNGVTVTICYRLPDSSVLTNLILPLHFTPN